jgi:hypothetical protein
VDFVEGQVKAVFGPTPEPSSGVAVPTSSSADPDTVLPRHSAPGQYLVAITRDQNGNGVVSEGLAATSEKLETSSRSQQISISEVQRRDNTSSRRPTSKIRPLTTIRFGSKNDSFSSMSPSPCAHN